MKEIVSKDLTVQNATIEQLEKAIEEKKKDQIPKARTIIDTYNIKDACTKHIESIFEGNYDESDIHHIFEAAMEATFGEEVWSWYNNHV